MGAGARLGEMANRPDVVERSSAGESSLVVPLLQRLSHGNCTDDGPVDGASWGAGTACYAGVWTNKTTVFYKPSARAGGNSTVL